MKKLFTLSALLATAIGAFSQGQVNFVNVFSTTLRAPVYGPELLTPGLGKHGNTATGTPAGTQTYSGPLLNGTGYTMELWGKVGANLAEGALEPLAQSRFRTGTAAGFIPALTVAVPNAPFDGTGYKATLQVRAWDNLLGTLNTWGAALAAGVPAAKSEVFSPSGDLGGTGTPAAATLNLVGLTSFNLTAVPEPGVIALGVLGLGALLLRRRK
jgi:hypothetical protein